MNPKVDEYLNKASLWQKEMVLVQKIILDCGLTEDLNWGKPCYSYKSSNIVIIQGFKSYLTVLFFKGVLLTDPDKILVKTGENTNVRRQIRFENIQEITELKSILEAYIFEAIEIEKAGLKVPSPEKKELAYPEEFQKKLDKTPVLKTAFEALAPVRQRAYIFYFSQPKQPKTRESRVEKYMEQILNGKGLND